MGFKEFCGNVSFWDENLLLNNTWPQFTECFQQTALVWVPCGFLWIISLAYLPYLRHVTVKLPGKVTWLNSAKTFFPLALCLLCVVSLFKTASLHDQSHTATSLYVADALRAVTFLYAGLLCILERRRGLVTSGVQFIFWLLTSLSDIIPFYSGIIQKGHGDDIFRFSLLCLEFTVTIIMLVLQFFSEAQHRHGYQALGQEEVSPELYASFPSRLTFWWSQRLMSMGFKKSLESKDLFPMDPVNQSRNIVPPFRHAWQAEVDRVNNINSKISPKKASFTKSAYDKTDDEHTPLLNNHTEIPQTRRDAQRDSTSATHDAPSHNDSTSATHDAPSHTRRTAKQVVTNKDREVTSENHTTRTNQPNQNGYGTGSTQGEIQGQTGEVSFKGQRRGQGHGATNGGTFPKGGKSKVELSASAPSEDDGKVHPSLFRVLVATYWLPFFIGQFLMLVYTLLQFVNPMVLNALLDYVNARDTSPEWQGYVLACSFFVASFTATFVFHQTQHNMMPLGMRVKSSIITAVYQKALTMSNESKRQSTVGEIVNLMSIDCQRLQDVTAFLYLTWSGPLTIAIALYQLWDILGPACLAGLGVMLLVIPVNLVVVSKQRKLQIATMRIKDQRLKIMAEVLNGIKVLKLYGWEPSFQDKVLYHRNRELDNLRKIAYLDACSTFIWTLVPYLVTLASFTAYILTSELGYLDSTKAFVSLSLFNIMRAPIILIPQIIPAVIQAGVSLKRVNTFLNWGDLDPDNVKKDPKAEDVIAIDDGTFIWDRAMPTPTLRSINMHIPEGKLVAVVGTVGCGKSSLLAAILGEMEKTKGTVTTKNTIAYVPQEAWIQNATVRDNITFGKPMSRRRYDQVVSACALESDFKILVGGDMTEIGEKGINLSGGQKQRVSVARAVYSDADTYLLDDPLSAVDSHVGKHIFHNVIGRQGVLANKTRILVTHGIHWLPMVDQIIVLIDGKVTEVGSYEELLSRDGAFATFLRTYLTRDSTSEDEDDEDPEIQRIKEGIFQRLESITSDAATSGDERRELGGIRRRVTKRQRSRGFSESEKTPPKAAAPPPQKEGMTRLVEEEQSMEGGVKFSVYLAYIRALGSYAWLFILWLYVMFQASSLTASIWLTQWTDDATLANTSLAGTQHYNDLNAMYLGVYGGLGAAQAVFIMAFSLLYNTRMVRATARMHAAMLINILRSPMAFFDTTPIGRILNRFSRDVDVMDVNLPQSARTTIVGVGNLLNTLILISYSSPVFLSVVLPLGVLYKLVQMFYIRTSRQLKRLESTTRSPVYTHFTETIQGATSIRAYGASDRFVRDSQDRLDKNLVCYFAYLVSQRWLGVRLELLGSVVTLAAALFAILNTSLSSGLVGLSVTYAMNVTQNLNFLVRASSELESNIVSTERIQEYSESPTEAEWTNPDHPVPNDWPEEGDVKFKDFELRYRPGLDLVLRGISFEVKSGEKIGIVGRTGAGKSSLTVALFRLVEAAAGCIVVDGHNTGHLGLHDLRRRLTILPQDPVIFSGTLRMNLDPTGSHDDSELWNALELAHLQAFVAGLPAKLNYECGEGGQNLSVGQRQLMCLARSVLRKSKILVLDEATAAVDMETDDVIQQTIRSEFKDSTVLTIAHRLNTILDYDRILVMEDGRVKEFAPPQQLLADSSSDFYGMAKAAGLV